MEQFEHAGHHVQRAEVGGYRGEVAAVDVLDDRTLFSTWRLYLFDRDLAQSDRVLAGGSILPLHSWSGRSGFAIPFTA